MKRRLLLLALVAGLLSSCSFPGLGLSRLHIGDLRTQQVDMPLPAEAGQEVSVSLRFGAARLNLNGGAEHLVQGSIRYNVDEFKPVFTTTAGKLIIEQGEEMEAALPPSGTRNEWDLRLNNSIPYALHIQAGAYQGTWNLGGLRLRLLDVTEGATKATYNFGQPNPESMETMNITTGASRVQLNDLANANFRQMNFNGGVGEYNLDFSGQLRQAAEAHIRTGVSSVTISVPQTTPARIRVRGALRTVHVTGDFQRDGDDYMTAGWNNASVRLDITVEMGLGTLELRGE